MSVNVSIPALRPTPTFFFFFSVLTVFAVELFSLLGRLLPSYAFMNICRVICLCALFERIVKIPVVSIDLFRRVVLFQYLLQSVTVTKLRCVCLKTSTQKTSIGWNENVALFRRLITWG